VHGVRLPDRAGGDHGRADQAPEIAARVAALREVTDLPIACGFGISTPEHVRAVVEHADAAIVGSALVRRGAGSEDPVGDDRVVPAELAGGLVGPERFLRNAEKPPAFAGGSC
jgi:tryptophan synthase alpha chain